MDLSELLVMLQYEIQKSYDFVEEISRAEKDEKTSVLHIVLERVELELPITLGETYTLFEPEKVKELPLPAQKLALPYKAQTAAKKGKVPEKKFGGKIISAKLIGATDKIDRRATPERIGRIKIVLKPILE